MRIKFILLTYITLLCSSKAWAEFSDLYITGEEEVGSGDLDDLEGSFDPRGNYPYKADYDPVPYDDDEDHHVSGPVGGVTFDDFLEANEEDNEEEGSAWGGISDIEKQHEREKELQREREREKQREREREIEKEKELRKMFKEEIEEIENERIEEDLIESDTIPDFFEEEDNIIPKKRPEVESIPHPPVPEPTTPKPSPTPTGTNNKNDNMDNTITILTQKGNDRQVSVFAQPGMLAAFIGGAVFGLLCAILVVMFIVYRMRKKDEGSYPLDEPKRMPLTSSYSPNDKEIYA